MNRLYLVFYRVGISVPIIITFALSDVYAFVEDYLQRPTDNGIQMILIYCFGHPNENITSDLIGQRDHKYILRWLYL
jgi:hypothetical protein